MSLQGTIWCGSSEVSTGSVVIWRYSESRHGRVPTFPIPWNSQLQIELDAVFA